MLPSNEHAAVRVRSGSVTSDPLDLLSRLHAGLHTSWLRNTYPFVKFGTKTSVHPTCDINRDASRFMQIEDFVFLGREVWLNVADVSFGSDAKIVLAKGCKIGRRSTISARNLIHLAEDVLLAPGVLLMDHNHEYGNTEQPIHAQGVTDGGTIRIEKNCWLGYACVVFCAKGNLTIGRNSVVGAHSVVTKSVPDYSIVAGNPAKVIKSYDISTKQWIKTAPSEDEE